MAETMEADDVNEFLNLYIELQNGFIKKRGEMELPTFEDLGFDKELEELETELMKESGKRKFDTSFNNDIVACYGTSQQLTKKRTHPKESTRVLRNWLMEHKDNPFPTASQKTELCAQSGLNTQQLNYWFTNARRRVLRPLMVTVTKQLADEQDFHT